MKIWKICVLSSFIVTFALNWGHSQEVISSNGGSHNDGLCTIEWTLGEPVSETAMDSEGFLTQGFHQPMILPAPPPKIPTIGEWGLICLVLLFLCIGLVALYKLTQHAAPETS